MKIRNARDDRGPDRLRYRYNPRFSEIDRMVTDTYIVDPDRAPPSRRIVIELQFEPRSGMIINARLHT